MALNRVHLAGEVTHDTRKNSTDSTLLPGDLVEINSDGTIKRQATQGEDCILLVVEENTPFNKTLTDTYATGDQVNLIYPMAGAKLAVRLKAGGSAVVIGDKLQASGTGKFEKLASGKALMVVEEAVNPTSESFVKATAIR